MSNLARPTSTNLGDTIAAIQCKLQRLGWVEVTRNGDDRHCNLKEKRLLAWALACLRHDELDPAILQRIESLPFERQWWAVRQFLPEGALFTLDKKLDGVLNEKSNSGGATLPICSPGYDDGSSPGYDDGSSPGYDDDGSSPGYDDGSSPGSSPTQDVRYLANR